MEEALVVLLAAPVLGFAAGARFSSVWIALSDTRVLVRLFNPRTDVWAEHFEIAAGAIVGKTAIGRATAALLQFNEPVRLAARTALILEGRLIV